MNLCLLNVVSMLALTLAALPVRAQEAPPRTDRPYRGLFGSGIGQASELLTLNLSVGEGYDDDILVRPSDTSALAGNIGGTYGQLDARLAYALQRSRVGIDASLATSSWYAPVLRSDFVASHGGRFEASLQLSERTRLTGSQSVTYQPFDNMSLFPPLFEFDLADARPPEHDFGLTRQQYISHASALDLTHGLSSRTVVALSYGYLRSDFVSGQRDFSSQRAGAHLTRGLTSRLSMNVGYDYQQGIYGLNADARQVLDHSLVGGIEYTKRLSAFSRTSVSVATGSSATSELGRTSYQFTASAGLSREIGRTWNVSLAYNRGPRFVETLTAPLFQDGLSFGVGGMVNQRIQFRSSAGISIGKVGLTARKGLDTYYGATALTVGLTRFVGLGFDYSYLRYSFEDVAFPPVGFAPALDRQRVRAYLTLWAPVIHRERNADAPR